MLEVLGVSAFDEAVYRSLLGQREETPADLAASLGVGSEQVDAALARLHALGLVAFHGDIVRATDPRVSLAPQVRERLDEIHGAWALVEELSGLYAAGELRTGSARLASVIDGEDSLAQWFTSLVESAQREILLIDAPPHRSTVQMGATSQHAKMSKGVSVRVLYGASMFELPGSLDRVLSDIAAGEQARVLPSVPFKLMVVDGACALLPMSLAAPATSDSVIVVHPSGLLEALVHHFELLWGQARPVVAGPDRGRAAPADSPTDEELTLLRLLDAGLTDDAVARHLGMSERTFRRRLTAMLDRLNAGSRFQAGARAHERGWI